MNTQTATIEEWRATHHPNYEVSNLGRVRSRALGLWRILRPGVSAKGYLRVNLGGGNTCLVHRLVAAAFIGPCPKDHEVMHSDHTPSNNRVENLAYGTSALNNMKSGEAGRRAHKLTAAQATKIRGIVAARWPVLYAKGRKQGLEEIGRQFGVTGALVGQIVRRQVWAHAV